MVLRLFYIFVVVSEILTVVNCQEYVKDLKPKEFKFIFKDQLPPVELPGPILLQGLAKLLNDQQSTENQTENENRSPKSQRPSLMEVALQVSVREGLNAMRHLYTEVEPNMVKNGQFLQANHPAALLSKFSAPLVETTKREMAAYATLTATKIFRKSYDLTNYLARQAHSQKVSLRRTALESLCPPRDLPICMPASERYRTHDGTCNNKKKLRWGAAQMPFNRFLPPVYGDGVDTTRNAANGGSMSSSRFVSLLVHGARDTEAPLTLMLAQWGQLLDHDMTSTAQPRSINGSVPSCCGSKDFHPSCFPIKVPLDDPWLSPLKVRCLEFLRSAPAQRRDCILSWREQTNQATSYIDASPIYSSSVKSSDNARVFRKGLLIFGRGNPADDVCQRGAIATHCIRSGDGRSGEQPGLLALHHVWVNEHNNIAMKLSEINLHWSDEKIYQETRRIIGAMFQHITFREFLPIVLGREVLKLFELELLNTGYYEGYDHEINPTVANAFSAAAFRFGHSLVQSSYMRCDRFHNIINNNVSLHEEFQRGDIGSVGSLHRLLRGMATQRALKRDEFITPELTNHLFQTPGFPFGLDLAAINVQRGRDHGIPPYTYWREPCGLSPINTWAEFANVVGPESARRISHAYESVYDIDLFVGGIAERPVVGGLVGPTFACIIAQQFSNSRKGDRFWYENSGFESSFTPAQLHSIRKVSLASVLCRTVGGGTFQPHIFLPPQLSNNERLPCGVAPLGDFELEPWLEQDPFNALGITHIQQQQQQQPSQPTLRPTFLTDRIFDVMQMDTKIPDKIDSPLSDHKVGFSNRHPAITVIKEALLRPPIGHTTQTSNSFLATRNSSKINDKLDLNKKRLTVHVTKQKPIPGVNNKLDKNNKGGNKQGALANTTRRTIIVNNVPIQLRHAGRDRAKEAFEAEPRLNNKDIMLDIGSTDSSGSKNKRMKTQIGQQNRSSEMGEPFQLQNKTEARTVNTDIEAENNKTVLNANKNFIVSGEKGEIKINIQTKQIESNTNDSIKNPCHTDILSNYVIVSEEHDIEEQNAQKHVTDMAKNNNIHNSNLAKDNKKINIFQPEDSSDTNKACTNLTSQKTKSNKFKFEHLELELTNSNETNNFKNSRTLDLKNNPRFDHKNDFEIDPMFQTIPMAHKRVQRKLTSTNSTVKVKEKLKSRPETNRNVTQIAVNNSRTLTTKTPKLSRTTLRPLEIRQYQHRLSYSKAPQKVIVDSVNGENQYEIEINIRQTNKSPKPFQTTPHKHEYTNIYKPNENNRYTNFYQTTPVYAYYQPATAQISSLTQNQRTKPPTVIFLDEHEDHKASKQPGYLQSVVGWNPATRRPLPASLGFIEKPSLETIIGSPHSTAHSPPSNQNPPSHLSLPASISSFSQAQVNTAGPVKASSASISSGSFGSIAGFASANGADSTFSFNIRPKPDKTQSDHAASYGVQLPQRNPWYEQNPPIGQQITNYDLPFRENVKSPFSTVNQNVYLNKNPTGVQRKEALTLTPAHEIADYDYSGRTVQPLGNVTSEEDTDNTKEDYEYDEDYGSSILIRNFNQDGLLRAKHEQEAILKTEKKTDKNNHTLDDNYVLPVLNSTKSLPNDLNFDLPKRIDTNLSTDFPDSLGKNLQTDIHAEDDNNRNNFKQNTQIKLDVLRDLQRKRNRNRHKNNKRRNHEKIAFAPINVLTKPERPDNWVVFNTPQSQRGETLLPQVPEVLMDPIPADEVPKPFKENIWLNLSKYKKTAPDLLPGPLAKLNLQTDINTDNIPLKVISD